ncbi:M23 family metallopeptidase, partial [Lactobacillus crispatus]
NKKKDIYVKTGQKIKLGQKIGKLTGSHLHLGVTQTNKDYINKYGFPCKNWNVNNGTWLNPIEVIKSNLKK